MADFRLVEKYDYNLMLMLVEHLKVAIKKTKFFKKPKLNKQFFLIKKKQNNFLLFFNKI